MKKFILFSAMMVCMTIQAQQYYPLVTAGKLWNTVFVYSLPPYPQHTEYQKFVGDTVVNGISYMKIFTGQDTLLNGWTQYALIREDGSHRVYQYNQWASLEFLLYDFSAVIGDTIVVNQGVHLVLDSIKPATLKTGETRNRYVWKNVEWAPAIINWESWIVGVGSELGILQPGSQAFVGGSSLLLCMHENDTLKYMLENNNNCDVLTAIPAEKKVPELTIWQVSADGKFMVNLSQVTANSVTLEVVNLLGSVVYSQPVNLPLSQPLNLNPLPSGIYILNLHNDQLNISRKFFRR